MKARSALIQACLIIAMFLAPATLKAQFTYTNNNDGTITITGYAGSGGAVIIPSIINGLSVSSIGSQAFVYCSSLTNVTIPDSVTDIGNSAFYGCNNLTNVDLGHGVTNIEAQAFYLCGSLTNVTFPDSLNQIGNNSFSFCSSLTSVTIPNSVVTIWDQAFGNCINLTNVTIPSSITSLRPLVFYSCYSLRSVYFEGNCPALSFNSFQNDSSVTVYYLPGTTGWGTMYGGFPTKLWIQFTYVTNLAAITITGYTGFGGAVTIPNTISNLTVTSIGNYALQLCTNLTSVTIPYSVTNIGNNAFDSCDYLTNVYFQGNAPTLGSFAFNGDNNSTVYYLPGTTGWDTTFGGVPTLLRNPVYQSTYYYAASNGTITITGYIGNGGEAVIPNTIDALPVTSIGNYSFQLCTNLTNVTIPTGVTSIGEYALYGCTSLTNVTIPTGVTSIGEYALSNCTSLSTVTMASSVTNIGRGAFYDCYSLTAVYFLGNSPSADSTVFAGDNNSTVYYLPGTTGWGTTFAGRPTMLLPYSYQSANGSIIINLYTGTNGAVNIPSSINGLPVTIIGPGAFRNCTSLISVTIPNSVNNIEQEAFFGCTKLSSVTIPNSVTSIAEELFDECSSLTGVTIPTNDTSIGPDAFASCSGLTSIIIPNSVTSIGSGAFLFCNNLKSITIPNSVTSIGSGAFSNCTNLTSVTIPNSVTSIAIDLFYECISLTSVTIPTTITNIGTYAFYDCSGLTSVTIPNSVTSIGVEAFAYCTSLTTVYFQGNAPSDVPSAFYDAPATAYYLPGTTGWAAKFGYLPTLLWNPQVQTIDASFGVVSNQFGFNITGNSNLVVLVEACTNLINPVWIPVATNSLTSGASYFSDPQWTNYPTHFYRIASE